MSAISDDFGGIQPRHFRIEHVLRRRIRVLTPALRNDAERGTPWKSCCASAPRFGACAAFRNWAR